MGKRLTQEEFEKRIEEQGNGEYTSLEEYQKANVSLLMKHENCGHKWKVKPKKFFEGTRCPVCAKKSEQLTQEEFEKLIEEKGNGEFTVLGEYRGRMKPVLLRHEVCGRELEIIPRNFYRGIRCRLCNGTGYRLTQEEFEDRVYQLGNGEYVPLENYQRSITPITMKHKVCGTKWKVRPNNFLCGKRCPFCDDKRRRLTQKEFEKKIEILENKKYVVLSEYQTYKSPIIMKHKACGYKWKTTPDRFFGGKRCPLCAGNTKKDTTSYVREVENLDENYKVLDKYKNNQEKIKMLHTECGNQFEMRPADFLTGQRCPHCKQSRGERDIANFLKNSSIEYEFQKRFKDCKDKRALPFDFYIPALNYCIEFDGKQHFEPVDYFGGEKAFKEVQRRDGIKTKYCEEKGIKLLRIRYDEDVEEKINSILKKSKA